MQVPRDLRRQLERGIGRQPLRPPFIGRVVLAFRVEGRHGTLPQFFLFVGLGLERRFSDLGHRGLDDLGVGPQFCRSAVQGEATQSDAPETWQHALRRARKEARQKAAGITTDANGVVVGPDWGEPEATIVTDGVDDGVRSGNAAAAAAVIAAAPKFDMDEKKGSSNPDPNVATEKCVSLQASVNDYWCSTECSNGACPKHLCVCGSCAAQLDACPVCRGPVERYLKMVGLGAAQVEGAEAEPGPSPPSSSSACADPELPFGGDLNAAMRAPDRDAIRELMQRRDAGASS